MTFGLNNRRLALAVASGLLIWMTPQTSWSQSTTAEKLESLKHLSLAGDGGVEQAVGFQRAASSQDRAVMRSNISQLTVQTHNWADMGTYLGGFYPDRYPRPDGSGPDAFMYSSSFAMAFPAGSWYADPQVHQGGGEFQGLNLGDFEAQDGALGGQFSNPPQLYFGYPMAAHSESPATWPSTGWPAPESEMDSWYGTEMWPKWERRGDLESFAVFDDSGAARNADSSVLNISVRKRVLGYSSGDYVFFQFEAENLSSNTYNDVYVGQFGDLGGPTYNSAVGYPKYDASRQLFYVVGANYNGAAGSHQDDSGRTVSWRAFQYLETPTGSFKKDGTGTLVDNPDQIIQRLSFLEYNDRVGGSDLPLYGALTGDLTTLTLSEAQVVWKTDPGTYDNPVYIQNSADFQAYNPGWASSADPFWYLSAGPVNFAPGDKLDFVVCYVGGITEGNMLSASDEARNIYQAQFNTSGPPTSPTLSAPGAEAGPAGLEFDPNIHRYPITYVDSGSITIYWDGQPSVQSRDAITGDQDFEGFRVYRSNNRGQTWGEVVTDQTGKQVGWTPMAQYDLENGITGPDAGGNVYLGDDTGLSHTFTDIDVLDGVEYWYAITAYDYAPPLSALESPIGSDPNALNVIAVISGARASGYVGGMLGTGPTAGNTIYLLNQTAAPNESQIWVEVRNDAAVTGDSYNLSVVDYYIGAIGDTVGNTLGTAAAGNETQGTGVTLTNTITSTVLLNARQTSLASLGGDNIPVAEGLRVYAMDVNEGNPGIYSFAEVPSPGDTTQKNSENGGAYYVAPIGYAGGSLERVIYNQNFDDYEVRFTGVTDAAGDTNMAVNRDISPRDYVQAPFELWNATTNTRVWPIIPWFFGTPDWDDGWEPIIITNIPYADDFFDPVLYPEHDATNATGYWSYTESNPATSRSDWLYWFAFGGPTDPLSSYPNETWRLTTYKPLRMYDGQSYSFSTTAPTVDPTQVSLDDVKVVPNPYYIFSEWDINENNRKIQFRNVPANSTIDIYTLSGELVASLDHSGDFTAAAGNKGYNSNLIGTVEWNIWTYEFTEAAYGLYIYVVKTDDGKTKVGKFAIIR